MGRGSRKEQPNPLRPGLRLDSRDVIFKSAGKSGSAIKQAEAEEAKKFARVRKRKEVEKRAPSEVDSSDNRY